ncbi:MAG: type II toxin-antitoxin system Phd/YefM family antitoxin [Ilumatobacteraceae bacterium]
MSQVITQRELRNGSGEIMRRLDEGESFVVTRNGVPVGELTPLRRLRFVSADAVVQSFRTAPPMDAEEFRRDLDFVASQDTAPRG